MAKAVYHQHEGPGVELEVLATGKGTVDLGRDKEVLVRGAPVAESAKIGHAVLIEEEAPKITKAQLTKAAKEARAAAEAAKKAAADAPLDGALADTAEAAELAAQSAEAAAK